MPANGVGARILAPFADRDGRIPVPGDGKDAYRFDSVPLPWPEFQELANRAWSFALAMQEYLQAEDIPPGTVRAIRTLLGETQDEFAERFSRSKRTIVRWENDGAPEVARETLEELAERLFRQLHEPWRE